MRHLITKRTTSYFNLKARSPKVLAGIFPCHPNPQCQQFPAFSRQSPSSSPLLSSPLLSSPPARSNSQRKLETKSMQQAIKDQSSCFLYKETRLNLDWDEAYGSTANVFLPTHHGGPSKRSSVHSSTFIPVPDDADTLFQHHHLASAASVYYRPVERYPRCIMWRVTENAQVLSLASVDFTKPNDARGEFATTFRFYFPEPIKPNCVGFTDAPGHDELVVYVMTVGKVIYTLSLTADFLLRNSLKAKNVKDSDYCSTYLPSSFTLHSPHFLIPIDHESLLVALQDGMLLKLEKGHTPPEDPDTSTSKYSEKTFSEGSYLAFMKNKLPWIRAGSVRHGNDSVSFSAVISSAIYTPKRSYHEMEDCQQGPEPLLFTVSVNHTLKTWSLRKGTLLHAIDLLNESLPTSNSTIKTLLDPSPSQLLHVIDSSLQEDHLFYLASFSSATTGKFKFWVAISDSNGQFENLVDLYPTHEFCVDPPTANSVWIISEFRITPVSANTPPIFNLWVLWKSNTTFRVQNLQFDMTDVPGSWNKWVTATLDSLHVRPGSAPSEVTSEDLTDYWLDWVFFPGRFTDEVLRTALKIHEGAYADRVDDGADSVQTKVARSIPSMVELKRGPDGSPDYGTYTYEIGLQWLRYCRLCTELDKQRSEALSLVADPVSGFVWTVNADGITALREATESEVLSHNYGTHAGNLPLLSERSPTLPAEAAKLSDALLLVQAASDLRNDLSDRAYDNCSYRLQREVLEDALYSFEDCMWSLYSNCLEGELSGFAYERIENAFEAITDPQTAFSSILESLLHPEAHSGQTKLTMFGRSVLIAGSQEVISVNYNLLFNLVFLLVLVSVPEDSRPRIAQPEQLYKKLLTRVREYEILSWVSRTPLSIPDRWLTVEEELTKGLASLRMDPSTFAVAMKRKGSVLSLLGENYGPPLGHGKNGILAVSACIRQFLAGLELGKKGGGVLEIASRLLGIEAVGAAVEFSKFLPTTAWGGYVKARIQLKYGGLEAAAGGFRKSGYGLAITDATCFSAVKSLLSEIELESSIGKGPSHYNLHVASLFEEAKAPLFVAEFCQAALISLGDRDSPELYTEILLKLFQSTLSISRFDEAYLALTRYTNIPLQRTSLRDLVNAMVSQSQGARLCSYPFVGLQDEVDEALSFKCASIMDVATGPPFHKVLYAWRIQHGDYRGAAEVLHERLQRLQTANIGSSDPTSRSVTDGFLVLLNAMSCVGEEQAWLLSSRRADEGGQGQGKRIRKEGSGAGAPLKRGVVTVEDVRKRYMAEVERVGKLLNGGFFV